MFTALATAIALGTDTCLSLPPAQVGIAGFFINDGPITTDAAAVATIVDFTDDTGDIREFPSVQTGPLITCKPGFAAEKCGDAAADDDADRWLEFTFPIEPIMVSESRVFE